MPKKARAGSTFGRQSSSTGAKAKAKAKQREDEDQAAEDRNRRRDLMALHRQDSEVREKERQYSEERRTSKKFKESENKAKRESREAYISRKEAEEKDKDAIIQKNILQRCILNERWLRHYDMHGYFAALGYWLGKKKPLSFQQNLSFDKWLIELRKKDQYEYFRAEHELLSGWPCPWSISKPEPHPTLPDSCKVCSYAIDFLDDMLWWRDTKLSLSHEWAENAVEIIAEGSQCLACLHVPVPIGLRPSDLEPCKRCEIGLEARKKLIDFWNHMQPKTEFLNHSQPHYKCVCEEDAVLPEDKDELAPYLHR